MGVSWIWDRQAPFPPYQVAHRDDAHAQQGTGKVSLSPSNLSWFASPETVKLQQIMLKRLIEKLPESDYHSLETA